MLEEVISELNRPASDKSSIPQSRVLEWMGSEDIETLGATYRFVMASEHAQRVSPPLEFDPVFDFILRYYVLCLKANPHGRWAASGGSAAMDLVRWFVWMWDEGRDKKYFETIKSRLAELYMSGSSELKDRIEHGIIEHLFERVPIREFFRDWRDKPQLRPAYEEGMLWIKGGGTSPLTQR
jgi:hypothetical protein